MATLDGKAEELTKKLEYERAKFQVRMCVKMYIVVLAGVFVVLLSKAQWVLSSAA